jgi:Flp pilus assembly protein TadG
MKLFSFIRDRGRSGQAIVETAMIMPVVLGLLMTLVQVGVVVSDQVQLDQFAYDGSLWAQENLPTANDAAIQRHVLDQLCGSGNSYPNSSAPTKFCRSGNLSVTASPRGASASNFPFPVNAEALSCRGWTLQPPTSSSSTNSVAQGSSITYTVTPSVAASVGQVPVITLSLSGTPPGTVPSFPVFNPPTVTGGNSATVTFSPSAATPLGPYTLGFSGRDQCNLPSGAGPLATTTLTVTGAAPPTPCSQAVVKVPKAFRKINPTITSVITLTGNNFQTGAIVSFGALSAPLVSVVSSTQLSVTLPVLPPGVYSITVTNPGGCAGTLRNAITVCNSASCSTTITSPSPLVDPCVSVAGSFETVVTIKWDEPLVIPWIRNTWTLTAAQSVLCQ